MANNQKLSPQGYNYADEPTNTNPFFDIDVIVHDVPKISATASVDDTTGTPAVTVTKSGTDDAPAFAFAFSGLKGEKGETGATGAAGANGVSPTITSTGSTESGALAGTITGADGTVINVYNGAQGAQGTAEADAVENVTLTNENGVYSLKQTKNGTETEVGTIEVPQVDTSNILAEITDSIVENTTSGYDFHTIRETEYNGTQNDVGHFYIARKQICEIDTNDETITFKTVNQSGEMEETAVAMPTGAIPKITATASVDDTTGTPAVTVTKSGTDDAPAFAFAFSGLKGEKGETGATGAAGANGVSPTITSTGSTESGALAGTITGADGTVINVYNGAQGEVGSGTGGTVAQATNTSLGTVKGFDTSNVSDFSSISSKAITAFINDEGQVKVLPPYVLDDGFDMIMTPGVVKAGSHVTIASDGTLSTTLAQIQSDFPITFSGSSGTFGSVTTTLNIGRILSIQVLNYFDSTRENPGVIITSIDFSYQNATSTSITVHYYLTKDITEITSLTISYNVLYYSS